MALLNLKKLDTNIIIDPLFRKASVDFDEGGVSGLLLNHLSMSGNAKIVLDASDVPSTSETVLNGEENESLHEIVDLSALKRE